MIRGCVFSYFITESDITIPELPIKKEFGKYTVLLDTKTPFSYASNRSSECAVFGLAVNVFSGDNENIAERILENCRNMQEVVDYEKQLGGKYMLLFKKEEQYYIQGDATCSIPIFYNIDDVFVCSSSYQYIMDVKKYHIDSEYDVIRKSGDISQAMPYDITPCRKIKQLIPNHYLVINDKKAVRFVNSNNTQKSISVEKAAETVLPMIENLLAYYRRYYKIYCPITSGRDSRVVLAFLMNSTDDICCYTIKHPEHHDDAQDIVVPVELCQKNNIAHKLIDDVVVTDILKNEMDLLLGEDNYSQRTLRIAQTINENFCDGAIVNGDIIGQVGKCSLHRDIPSVFATPSYFRCKLHNYSKEAKKQLGLWLEEIKASGEKVNTFDLFSVENRMGRWAAQENLIYNTIGQLYLNIFNCRSIIYTWTAVSRKKRKLSLLHVDLIREEAPQLLEIPFERDESIMFKISKATGMLYLLSSYAKFYIERMRFEKRKNDEKANNNSR